MSTPSFRHWKLGGGVPVAVTLKVTGDPSHTDWSVGSLVMVGATSTVSVAAVITLIIAYEISVFFVDSEYEFPDIQLSYL